MISYNDYCISISYGILFIQTVPYAAPCRIVTKLVPKKRHYMVQFWENRSEKRQFMVKFRKNGHYI